MSIESLKRKESDNSPEEIIRSATVKRLVELFGNVDPDTVGKTRLPLGALLETKEPELGWVSTVQSLNGHVNAEYRRIQDPSGLPDNAQIAQYLLHGSHKQANFTLLVMECADGFSMIEQIDEKGIATTINRIDDPFFQQIAPILQLDIPPIK